MNLAMHVAALNDERECLELLFRFDANPTLVTFSGHSPKALARRRGHLRTAEWLATAETDWLARHPPQLRKKVFKFTECKCSFCSTLREVLGDRQHPRYATVGAHREVRPGYTKLHDPSVRHLVSQAYRRSVMPKKTTEGANDG